MIEENSKQWTCVWVYVHETGLLGLSNGINFKKHVNSQSCGEMQT